MTNNNTKIECQTRGKFKRLRPFNGMLLTAEDVQLEQNYFREKMKLHNRLHGFGVVCGLEIEPDAANTKNIIVTPGMALDYSGNEIIVCEGKTVELENFIQELFAKHGCISPGEPLKDPLKLYIGIKYDERPSDPVPVIATDCDAHQSKRSEFSRMTECFCNGVFIDEPPWQPPENSKVEGLEHLWVPDCPLRPDCEHYIILGSISFSSPSVLPITESMIANYWNRKSATVNVPYLSKAADKSEVTPVEKTNQLTAVETKTTVPKPLKKKSQKISPK